MKNNEENREELAASIVEGWDLNNVIAAMVRRLVADYEHDDELFQMDWEVEFGEDEGGVDE
jgi:hypothetical protein